MNKNEVQEIVIKKRFAFGNLRLLILIITDSFVKGIN